MAVIAPMNYAEQYGQELANAYPYLSYFADIWNQGEGARFRPLRGKTVYIPSMTVGGARAVNRNQIDGVFNRNFNVDWQARVGYPRRPHGYGRNQRSCHDCERHPHVQRAAESA